MIISDNQTGVGVLEIRLFNRKVHKVKSLNTETGDAEMYATITYEETELARKGELTTKVATTYGKIIGTGGSIERNPPNTLQTFIIKDTDFKVYKKGGENPLSDSDLMTLFKPEFCNSNYCGHIDNGEELLCKEVGRCNYDTREKEAS